MSSGGPLGVSCSLGKAWIRVSLRSDYGSGSGKMVRPQDMSPTTPPRVASGSSTSSTASHSQERCHSLSVLTAGKLLTSFLMCLRQVNQSR